jgi:hypothetical protein
VYQHPALREALMRDRVAELRDSARTTARTPRDPHLHKLVAATRHVTGWLLVDIGLRLAAPPGGTNHPVSRSQR